MNVVIRGLMASGLFVYGAIHMVQGVRPPEGAPAWLRLAFIGTAVLAIVLGAGLIAGQPGRTDRLKDLAAVLAVASAVALGLSFTTGFLGVNETDLRVSTLVVVVAEFVVVACWVIAKMVGHDYDEVQEAVPDVGRGRT